MLSLVSINIEGRRHLERVSDFLMEQKPDVVCLQELCRQDIPYFESLLKAKGYFVPMCVHKKWNDDEGVGIFSPYVDKIDSVQYGGQTGEIMVQDETSMESRYLTTAFPLLVAQIDKEGEKFTISTTHFPVTAEGQATDFQREARDNLLNALKQYESIILCGDMNAPRGREIFSSIAEVYKDNIPSEYETSIDKDLHRAGALPYMVDGLFSTSDYVVDGVCLQNGVSDHLAVVANISKK